MPKTKNLLENDFKQEYQTIHNQLEQNPNYDDFDSQTAKIPDFSTGRFSNYEYVTGNYVLADKRL